MPNVHALAYYKCMLLSLNDGKIILIQLYHKQLRRSVVIQVYAGKVLYITTQTDKIPWQHTN